MTTHVLFKLTVCVALSTITFFINFWRKKKSRKNIPKTHLFLFTKHINQITLINNKLNIHFISHRIPKIKREYNIDNLQRYENKTFGNKEIIFYVKQK